MKGNPAERSISARRGDAEARINFIEKSPRQEYYREDAVAACSLERVNPLPVRQAARLANHSIPLVEIPAIGTRPHPVRFLHTQSKKKSSAKGDDVSPNPRDNPQSRQRIFVVCQVK
jgi:hypothetical protein